MAGRAAPAGTRRSSGRSTSSGFYDAAGNGDRRRVRLTARRPRPPSGFDRGAHLLIDRALRALRPVRRLDVVGGRPGAAACTCARGAAPAGHGSPSATRSAAHASDAGRALDATAGPAPSGRARRGADGLVAPPARALGPRRARRAGRVRRPGGAAFDLDDRDVVWADIAPRLYAQAAAAQWDPATAIDWSAPSTLPARSRPRSSR